MSTTPIHPPAGTTQTPLTDALLEYTATIYPDQEHNQLVAHARGLELALAASKAREAELVKALETMTERAKAMGWDGPASKKYYAENLAAYEQATAVLTAPPTNSKEMNK